MGEAIRQRRHQELPSPNPETVTELGLDHPAILQELPLFPKTIVNANDSDRLFIPGENNRKIGKVVTKGAWKGMPLYTLTLAERVTCPSDCFMWRSCYGNAMPFARRHAPGMELEQRIGIEIAALAKQHRRGFVVRLHVLGDFYSLDYVKLWQRLLLQHKELHVYGYTAHAMTSANAQSKEIASLLLRLRGDRWFVRTSSPTRLPGGATVIDRIPEGVAVPEGIVCPAERDATECCATCGICWSPNFRNNTIVFVRHGMGSNKTEKLAKTASKTNADGHRKVEPLPNITRLAGKITNKPPTLMWIDPRELTVDETYQRNLSHKSIHLISRTVQGWSWAHFKPPIVVRDADSFYIIDGQHTAIAAASHPDIEQIPVMVIDGANNMQDRARAFIGHNKDRIAITATQMHYSSLVAGDPEAKAVDAVCAAAGVRVVKGYSNASSWKPGDTAALQPIRASLRLYGPEKTERTLRILTNARCAPIRSDQIQAVNRLLFSEAFGEVDDAALSLTIELLPIETAIREARDIASATGQKVFEGLSVVYSKALHGAQHAEAAE